VHAAAALAAASATEAFAQFTRGRMPPAKPPAGSPPRDDQRALYREERFIRHLYQGFLRREPSREELRSWTDRLGRRDRPIDLVQAFMDSDEYFIRETYRGLLGREPDTSGMDTYIQSLRGGGSREDMVEEILRSPEFRKRLGRRRTAFASSLRAPPAGGGASPAVPIALAYERWVAPVAVRNGRDEKSRRPT
jgi:hypothetical protein